MDAFFFNYLTICSLMKYLTIIFIILFSTPLLVAQNSEVEKSLDSLYREDQIYFSITYNILDNKSQSIEQNGLSGGFHLGVIRDFPINKKRNIAFGIGLGLSSNSFRHNLKISDTYNEPGFEVISSDEFSKNRFNMYQVEMPFEFRWRTSTSETYSFWRIYTGFKIGYVFSTKNKLISLSETNIINLENIINKLQYGLSLSAGYSSFNLHLYYGLSTIFKDQKLNNESIDLKALKVGLIFYIL